MIDVAAGVVVKDNRVLVARRSPHKHLGGFWEFPGGKVEQSESLFDALLRELGEELEIRVKVGAMIEESIFQYGDITVRLVGFWCEWLSGELKLNDHDSVEWRDLKDLIDLNWAPADLPIVERVLKSGIPNFTVDSTKTLP